MPLSCRAALQAKPRGPNQPGAAFTNTANWFGQGVNNSNSHQINVKGDHNFSASDRVSGRYSQARSSGTNPNLFGDFSFRGQLLEAGSVKVTMTHAIHSSTIVDGDRIIPAGEACGFVIEFEFADDGTPAKAVYKHTNADGTEITEEDRYAQFIDVGGVKTPFIIDRYTNGAQNSRINYDTVEFNKTIPDSVFAKPANPKELKKDLKL